MTDTPQFEIPAAVREMAERNVAQVRNSYEQVLALMRRTQDAVMKSQGAMAQSGLMLQAKCMEYAQANVMASFAFAADLSRARDLKEYLDVQSRFAQQQLEAYARQAQEITRLMNDALHKSP